MYRILVWSMETTFPGIKCTTIGRLHYKIELYLELNIYYEHAMFVKRISSLSFHKKMEQKQKEQNQNVEYVMNFHKRIIQTQFRICILRSGSVFCPCLLH